MTTKSLTDWRRTQDALQQAISLNQLQVIVPTINSEDYIEIVLGYYKDIGLPITLVVDSKVDRRHRGEVTWHGS